LTLAVGGGWWLQQHLDRIGAPLFLAGAGAVVVLAAIAVPTRLASGLRREPLLGVLALVALCSAVFFRTRYLWTVPSGYEYEPLGFLFFAHRLIVEHFPYIPYAWYAHTLYSYWIALAMLVIDSEMTAYRVAVAAMSILTVGVLYLCAARLFGRRVAWITTALLAASWWHMWASRNGYHQQLMPLIHALYLYGVVVGFTGSPWRGFALAGLAIVVGLHGYWGLYLLLPVSLGIAVYVIAWHRESWRRSWLALLCSVAAALVLLIPLGRFFTQQFQIFAYVQRAISEPTADVTSVPEKRLNNAHYILWSLSGHPAAQVPYGSVVDPLVACTALIGLGVALRRWRSSIPHAVLLLLLLCNVAGLVFTIANYFYITATMASVYLLAGIGVAAILDAWEGWWPALASPLLILSLAVIGLQTAANYQAFFYKHAITDLRSPDEPSGRSFLLLDEIAQLVGDHAVFLPREEPGRDFDGQIFELGLRVPSYAFVHRTLPFDATRVLFPQHLVGDHDVEIFVPNRPFVEARLLPVLRLLYPNLQVTRIAPPEPYLTHDATPIAFRIGISIADLTARYGLLPATGGDRSVRSGLFEAPVDGKYRFRVAGDSAGAMLLHGRPVKLEETTVLEAGLHPIRIEGWSSAAIEWQGEGQPWQKIDPTLVNSGEVDAAEINPYLAHQGAVSEFYYSQRDEQLLSDTLRDAVIYKDGSLLLFDATHLLRTNAQGAPEAVVPLDKLHDGWAFASGGEILLADPGGSSYRVRDGRLEAAAPGPCGTIALTGDAQGLVFLCADGRLLDTGEPRVEFRPRGPHGQPLLEATQIARYGHDYFVVDSQASEVLRYDAQGTLRDRRVLRHLWSDSEIAFDPDGNLYVKHRLFGVRTYTADGTLLFHPLTGLPALLVSREQQELDTVTPRRLKFAGAYGVAVTPQGYYKVFDRRAQH
jgi:hypothetical protein